MRLSDYGAIDCDVHPALVSTRQLRPYLDDYWQEMLTVRNIDGLELNSFPPNAELFGRPDWRPKDGSKPGSDLAMMQSRRARPFRDEIRHCELPVRRPIGL